MVMIFLIESNVAIIAAAFPGVLHFFEHVNTGLLVPAPMDIQAGSESGSKGDRYSVQTSRKDSQARRSIGWMSQYVPSMHELYSAEAQDEPHRVDAESERDYGSEVTLVRG